MLHRVPSVLFSAGTVVVARKLGRTLHDERIMRQLIGYPATVILLAIVWAFCNRPQLEQRRNGLASMFALVTIIALGRWFARFMLSH